MPSFLQSLEKDYTKNQDVLPGVLGVLQTWLSGGNFELVLAAAAATGNLQTICFRLIK